MALSTGAWAGIAIVCFFVLVGIFLLGYRGGQRHYINKQISQWAAEETKKIPKSTKKYEKIDGPSGYGTALETATGEIVKGRWGHGRFTPYITQ
jgi:hypothetical protein